MFKNKIFPVIYGPGMRGQSFSRIMQAHKEVYYQPDNIRTWLQFSDSFIEETKLDSLAVDEEVCEFKADRDFAYNRFANSTFHNDSSKTHWIKNTSLASYLKEKQFETKLLFQILHDDIYNDRLSKNIIIDKLYSSDKPYVNLYGHVDRSFFPKMYFPPHERSNAININIDSLYSVDYEQFEEEYFKILRIFNLYSRLNRVRSFILLNLDRQKYMSKYDEGKKTLHLTYHTNPINN